MKTFFVLVVIGLVVFGFYYFSKSGPLENIKVENNTVTVNTGNSVVQFLILGDFQNTYMLFGGEYFKNKKIANPISLSGLDIRDANEIYEKYPDFHRCSSPGAALAKPKVQLLNLIPKDKSNLDKLKTAVKKQDENFANKDDRICISLTGKILDPKSPQPVPQDFYLIHSSKTVDCKNLLEEIKTQPAVSPKEPQDMPEIRDFSNEKMENDVTNFLKHLSEREIDHVYTYTTNFFKNNIPQEDIFVLIDTYLSDRAFLRQEKNDFSEYYGWVETFDGGTKNAMIYEYYGTVYFSDESEKDFFVGFVLENEEWKIHFIGFKDLFKIE